MATSTTENKPRVLIIDDNPLILKTIGALLGSDYDIIIAKTGAKGLASAQKHIPDIILLDIIMPEMTGFDVIKILKEEDTTKNIPVIFLSGDDTTESIKKGFELGAVDYVEKFLVEEVVKESVDKILKSKI
ncbi:MAG: response regulator [Defluviitaleaceae bacterium]|nr:response regulator [Defluviitaleaceae bacterium]